MKNEGRAMIVVIAYILTMLLITLVAIVMIRNISKRTIEHVPDNEDKGITTEIVYVPVYAESESEGDSETEKTEPSVTYMVKEHEGRVGIYENGELAYLLDVYTKTLPKSDRDLLKEGIMAYSKAELKKIIEDYTT